MTDAYLLDPHIPAALDVEESGGVGGVGVHMTEPWGHTTIQVPHTLLEPVGRGLLSVCMYVFIWLEYTGPHQ